MERLSLGESSWLHLMEPRRADAAVTSWCRLVGQNASLSHHAPLYSGGRLGSRASPQDTCLEPSRNESVELHLKSETRRPCPCNRGVAAAGILTDSFCPARV